MTGAADVVLIHGAWHGTAFNDPESLTYRCFYGSVVTD